MTLDNYDAVKAAEGVARHIYPILHGGKRDADGRWVISVDPNSPGFKGRFAKIVSDLNRKYGNRGDYVR